MRKKNIMLGVIGFVLAVVTGGQAFAALAEGEISMGVFSIPLPGCAPEVTISEKDTSSGCYTMTIQNKTLQNGVCSSYGISPTPKQVCDGKDGAGGGDGIIDDVQGVYVPYPQSRGTCSGGTCQYPDRQGYMTTTVSFTDDARQPVVNIVLDPCEVFYDETDDNKAKKKCTAQGDATSWPNSDNSGNYEANESYIFEISDPATTLDSGVSPNPYYEYVEPTKNASGWFENPGHTVKVTVFVNGQQKREFYAADRCDKYKNPSDLSAEAVVKCTVGAPGKAPGYVADVTKYCLNINPNLCGNYNSLVDDGVCAGAGEDASRTARSTTTEYYGPSGDSNSTSRNVGYVATTQVMCSNDSDDDITATHNDPCTPASNPTVTCASGYTWQTCTNQTKTTETYTGCFPSNLGQLFAYKDEIVPVSLAADTNNLYYCKIADCDSDSTCWIEGSKANGPNPEATACWGTVSITGLTGDAGPGCSFIYNGTKWQTCCWPVTSGGAVDTTRSPTCTDVTGDLLNQLNNWMCKPTYTTYYIDKQTNGNYVYNRATATNERSANTVGIRTKITNCDGTFGGDVDVFDGETGNDYNPCDGLSSAEALSTVSRRTTVYVRHGSTDSSTTTTGIGYYTETNVMCDTSGNKIVKKYDRCDPVSLASGASRTVGTTICSGNQTLLMCTPQEEPTAPYYVCSGAEVSSYPKLVYVAPTVSGGKFTARGYTKWVHKYTSGGAEVDGTERHNPDECHTVYKRTFGMATDDGTGVRTATTTTLSTLKCKVQNPGTSVWGVGTEYCLNTTDNASTSCNGYAESTSDVTTSTLKYHLPIMGTGANSNKPLKPGYTYNEEASGEIALRGTNQEYDKCETVLARTESGSSTVTASVTKCTVGAPTGTPGLASPYTAEATYCLGYANGTCPGSLIDIGSAIDDAAENDPCAGISGTDDRARAVKKVVSRTYTRTTGSQGALTSVYKMCNDDDHAETTPDECHEIIPTPAGETCANGVWMQCKRQANEGTSSATARGTTYGYCATYPQCSGTNSSSSSIVKKTQRSYTAPTKTSSGDTYYTTPGKVTDVKIACNDSTISTAESAEDQCEEIPDTNSICPTNKVLKTCKRKGDESSTLKAESTYNLCATGTSIFGTISDNDPCGGDTTTDAAKKKVKSIQYEYVAPVTGEQSKRVGYSVKTTTMCHITDGTNDTLTEYIYDTCKPLAASNSCKSGSTYKPYYKCNKQTYDASNANTTNREYNACDPLPAAVALSSAVANKLDSDVTFEVKPNSQDSNKNYITITGTNITDKPMVSLESLQGQSVFDIWKEEQTDDTKCRALFDKNCSGLTASDMLLDLSAQGNWARSEYGKDQSLTHDDLGSDDFQESLKPCKSFDISEDAGYDGSQGAGKRYTMTCVE